MKNAIFANVHVHTLWRSKNIETHSVLGTAFPECPKGLILFYIYIYIYIGPVGYWILFDIIGYFQILYLVLVSVLALVLVRGVGQRAPNRGSFIMAPTA